MATCQTQTVSHQSLVQLGSDVCDGVTLSPHHQQIQLVVLNCKTYITFYSSVHHICNTTIMLLCSDEHAYSKWNMCVYVKMVAERPKFLS